jgi:hypothetical protein
MRHTDLGKTDKYASDLESKESNTGNILKKLDIDLKHFTPSTKGKLQDLICKWKAVFSTGPTDLGYTRLVEHEINLTDDKPYRDPYRRIPPSMFDEVREHLREMLEIGVIRESSSLYSSNLVLVRKSDGSLRLCIDYRGGFLRQLN